MPAPIRLVLTPVRRLNIIGLREAIGVLQRTRERAHMLRLNAQG